MAGVDVNPGQCSQPAVSLSPAGAQTFSSPCHLACGPNADPGTNDIPAPSVYRKLAILKRAFAMMKAKGNVEEYKPFSACKTEVDNRERLSSRRGGRGWRWVRPPSVGYRQVLA